MSQTSWVPLFSRLKNESFHFLKPGDRPYKCKFTLFSPENSGTQQFTFFWSQDVYPCMFQTFSRRPPNASSTFSQHFRDRGSSLAVSVHRVWFGLKLFIQLLTAPKSTKSSHVLNISQKDVCEISYVDMCVWHFEHWNTIRANLASTWPQFRRTQLGLSVSNAIFGAASQVNRCVFSRPSL